MEFYGNACQTQSSVGNSPFCEFTVEMKYMMKMIIIAIDQTLITLFMQRLLEDILI